MTEIEEKTQALKKKIHSQPLTKDWLERTIISLGLYGRISGVIGSYIIANLNGRMIIRSRPKNFQMSMTKAAISGRRSLAAATKYALFLKNIKPVYNTWTKAKIKGNNAFTRIIKHNKKYLSGYHPSALNTITPEGCSIYLEDVISMKRNGQIRVTQETGNHEKMIILIAAIDPKNKTSNDFELLEVHCSGVKTGQVIELAPWQIVICRNYKRFILYSAIIKQNGQTIQWSNTIVKEADFDFGVDCNKAEHLGYGQIPSSFTNVYSFNEIVVKPPGKVFRI